MSANDRRGVRGNRDGEMAADLKRRGIYHGKHQTSSNADPMSYLDPGLVGSAKYRRLRKK